MGLLYLYACRFSELVVLCMFVFTRTAVISTLITRIASYPDRFGLSGKFVQNSTKPNCLETTGIGSGTVQYCVVLWLIELRIGRGRMV
jgi:hypothetical protein